MHSFASHIFSPLFTLLIIQRQQTLIFLLSEYNAIFGGWFLWEDQPLHGNYFQNRAPYMFCHPSKLQQAEWTGSGYFKAVQLWVLHQSLPIIGPAYSVSYTSKPFKNMKEVNVYLILDMNMKHLRKMRLEPSLLQCRMMATASIMRQGKMLPN